MKTLPPQRLKQSDYKGMAEQIRRVFYRIVFAPLMAILKKYSPQFSDSEITIENAGPDALDAALRSGRVQYEQGIFSGDFNAAIGVRLRAIGAKWYRAESVYKLDLAKVPGWVKAASTTYQSRAQSVHEALKRELDGMQQNLDHAVDAYPVDARATIGHIEKGFQRVGAALQVNPELTQHGKDALAKEYSNNMKLSIRRFSKASISDLRETVDKNANQGYRFDRLVDDIKYRFSTTENKAKFLARQETALYMAKFREQRFKDAGVLHYRWSTSHDERVRPARGTSSSDNHRVLDGRVFAYDDPPVVDQATGRRANPGQDFNCRCVDIAILEPIHRTEAVNV